MNKRWIIHVMNILGVLTVAGCANKDAMLPTPDQTMREVYNEAMTSSENNKVSDVRTVLRRGLTQSESDLSPYVRTEATQLESKFKLLPNPTLYMFVAPHLATRDEVPVPGYLTEFKLYTKDHYALPGEINSVDQE